MARDGGDPERVPDIVHRERFQEPVPLDRLIVGRDRTVRFTVDDPHRKIGRLVDVNVFEPGLLRKGRRARRKFQMGEAFTRIVDDGNRIAFERACDHAVVTLDRRLVFERLDVRKPEIHVGESALGTILKNPS